MTHLRPAAPSWTTLDGACRVCRTDTLFMVQPLTGELVEWCVRCDSSRKVERTNAA